MTDRIEKHFIERIETHLWVGDYIASGKDYEPTPRKIKEQLDNAKLFMKMLNKYQKLKK